MGQAFKEKQAIAAMFVKDKTPDATIKAMFQMWFANFEVPKRMIHDLGELSSPKLREEKFCLKI